MRKKGGHRYSKWNGAHGTFYQASNAAGMAGGLRVSEDRGAEDLRSQSPGSGFSRPAASGHLGWLSGGCG